MFNQEQIDLILQGMAGAEEEKVIQNTDDEKTGDYEQQQNYQEIIDEEDLEATKGLSISGIKATSYRRYPATSIWS